MDYPIRKSPFIMPHSPCKLMNKILETYDILKNIPYIFFSRHEQTCFNAIEITKENPAKEKKWKGKNHICRIFSHRCGEYQFGFFQTNVF